MFFGNQGESLRPFFFDCPFGGCPTAVHRCAASTGLKMDVTLSRLLQMRLAHDGAWRVEHDLLGAGAV